MSLNWRLKVCFKGWMEICHELVLNLRAGVNMGEATSWEERFLLNTPAKSIFPPLQHVSFPTMTNDTVSVRPSPSREAIPARNVSKKMSESLDVVIGWQNAELPPRFAIGSGDLRKTAIRVREQPVNFMVIIQQSIKTAENGQSLCRSGSKAVKVLLGDEDDGESERDKVQYAKRTVEDIKGSASDLNNHTLEIKNKFRALRTSVLDLHKGLDNVTSNEQRSAFLARLSRVLSKDVAICEQELRKVRDNLEEIENSLNLITQWWQKIESEANYLQMNGGSTLMPKENRILLNKIKESFMTLERWFEDYVRTMSQLFDEKFTYLNDDNKKYLTKVQRSPEGRLEASR